MRPRVVRVRLAPCEPQRSVTRTAAQWNANRSATHKTPAAPIGPPSSHANPRQATGPRAKPKSVLLAKWGNWHPARYMHPACSYTVANKCYSKLATKHGILRKQNNRTRPTNSFRLVASPSLGISFGKNQVHSILEKGLVEIPRNVLRKAKFMRMNDSSTCYMSRMQIGEVIVIGRCPSQGPDSTIPLRVKEAPEGINSVGIPLQLCTLTNADFDGDEVWGLVSMTREGSRELEERWNQIWNVDPPKPIFEDVYTIAVINNIPPEVDPAILTTMTFDEMSEHPGGLMYESMAGMMMGTVIDGYKDNVVVMSTRTLEMPLLKKNLPLERTTCCLALIKMTRAVY
ncbi:hypothetical protein F4803DRAFT_575154 [Xylaria telfairii]|nr:hypothetical protein F4803DRAFT_575154 [Xylaria telfairii]